MRVGTLCFSTCQGIGLLAKDLFDHGVITDALVLRHGRRPDNDDWFPRQPRLASLSDRKAVFDFVRSLDVFFAIETPFIWEAFPFCRQHGIRTVLLVMVECMPTVWPAQPDKVINPSLLDQQYFPEGEHIPIPVSVPWRQRTRAEVFVHNAGNGGLKGRNGTRELLQAWTHVRSPAKLILRYQSAQGIFPEPLVGAAKDGRIELRCGTFPHETLWGEGDVFVFPDRFQGLSLPLQEARAAGMLVMATDRFPHNTWLPRGPLIPPRDFRRIRVAPRCLEVDEAVVDPLAIAAKIDEWYGKDIADYSFLTKAWAETMSWGALKGRWMEALCG